MDLDKLKIKDIEEYMKQAGSSEYRYRSLKENYLDKMPLVAIDLINLYDEIGDNFDLSHASSEEFEAYQTIERSMGELKKMNKIWEESFSKVKHGVFQKKLGDFNEIEISLYEFTLICKAALWHSGRVITVDAMHFTSVSRLNMWVFLYDEFRRRFNLDSAIDRDGKEKHQSVSSGNKNAKDSVQAESNTFNNYGSGDFNYNSVSKSGNVDNSKSTKQSPSNKFFDFLFHQWRKVLFTAFLSLLFLMSKIL